MKILVVGGGAIGGLYGGLLAKAGAKGSFVCRSNYKVIKEHGFDVKTALGDFNFKPEQVLKNTDDYQGVADYVLVTTKVLPEVDFIELLKPVIKNNTTIILLQNGIHIENDIAAAFPGIEIISGLAFVCVSQFEPGIIDHQDYGRLVLGVFPRGLSPKLEAIAELYRSVGLELETTDNIVKCRWKKLVWNAPYNPLSVIGRSATTEDIMLNKAMVTVVKKVMEEVCLLADLDGCPLKETVIDNNLDATEKMTAYKTSMVLDFENGRALETEAILGNAVRFAAENKVEVPYLKFLYVSLKLIERKG
mgnify:CR=1 FL=1